MEIAELVNRIQTQRQGVDVSLVERAYEFARRAHEGERRLTGEPFITHPLEVASILSELGMDEATIAAGLLHDVMEDCGVAPETLQAQFGEEVARLVSGVTKLMKMDFSSNEQKQAENLRKLFFAMSEDIRVIIIKLADRLHNMRTLDPFAPQRQQEIAQETLQVFAPIAHRLGIWRMKWELEDRSLKYLEPEVYAEIVSRVDKTRGERMHLIEEATAQLAQRLKAEGIEAEIQGRPKHFYSIYEKIRKQELDFDKIYDLTAIRVIVSTVPQCYHALNVVHQLWMPIEGFFTDHIAKPKANGYRSLHTKVFGPNGEPMEVQIRTGEMHRSAEFGIAAHWRYKREGEREEKFGDQLRWLRVVMELESDHNDPEEFLDSLKLDLYKDQVIVFTPRGDPIELPAGSTPVDFAFRIHSEVGNRCVGARVNGAIKPLDSKLQNGDICEILTSKTSPGPKRAWLEFVQTPQARSRIKTFLRKQSYEENLRDGRERLEKACEAARLTLTKINNARLLDKLARSFNHKNAEDLIAAIGWGDVAEEGVLTKVQVEVQREGRERLEKAARQAQLSLNDLLTSGVMNKVAQLLNLRDAEDLVAAVGWGEVSTESVIVNAQIEWRRQQEITPPKKRLRSKGEGQGRLDIGVAAKGVDNVFFRLSKCCAPIRGDHIVGYVTRGRGVTVHRTDCPNVQTYRVREADRLIEVEWTFDANVTYQVEITVEAFDRVGLLSDVTGIISEKKINIESAQVKTDPNRRARINCVLSINHLSDLNAVMEAIKQLPDVREVHRVRG